MKITRFIFPMLLLLLSSSLMAHCLGPAAKSYPRFVASKRSPFQIPKGLDYTFGYLEVLENRSQPEGRVVRCPVYRFASLAEQPQPDPVVFTAGGPGSSSLRNAPWMKYWKYLQERDIILFEQRGTLWAEPHLDCPEVAAARALRVGRSAEEREAEVVEAVKNCRGRWEKKGVDLDQYRTGVIAEDLEDLRRVWQIPRWNLLCTSYSTRIGQVMLRRYPETLRAVVLDSPMPMERRYDEEALANHVAILDKLLESCGQDSTCKGDFPELKQRFWEWMEQLENKPLNLRVATGDGDSLVLKVGPGMILGTIPLSATAALPEIPRELDRLIRGDYWNLRAELSGDDSMGDNGAGLGLRLSVWSAEEWPHNDPAAIARAESAHPGLGDFRGAVFSPAVCRAWKVAPAPAEFHAPVTANVPVLIVVGEFDPFTPPAWARQLAGHLPNAYVFEVPGTGHGPTFYWDNPCAMDLAQAFFQDPTRRPAAECWDDWQPIQFEGKD